MKKAKRSLPLTDQKLWSMAKLITAAQKKAKEQKKSTKVDWDLLEEDWFDWLNDQLFGDTH